MSGNSQFPIPNSQLRDGTQRATLNWVCAAAGLSVIVALAIWSATAPVAEHEIGSYATGLKGRASSQIYNVRLATRAINNKVIPPGGVFSFVRTIGSWTADLGYVKAPVSYDGELVRSWGGGVCQASSTLYNAALLAGLEIVERHRHHWPARYAPLGRDAAVAYSDIDLKFRNNLPAPIRIVGAIEGEKLVFRIMSTCRPDYSVRVESQVRSVTRPTEVVQDRTGSGEGRWRLINRGHPGFYVVTYRRFLPHGVSGFQIPKHQRQSEWSKGGTEIPKHDRERVELVSEDRYPPLHRVIRIAER